MSVVFRDEMLCACYVTRNAQSPPTVEWFANYSLKGADKPLEKFGKDVHANRYACTTLLAPNEYQVLSVEAPTVPREELKTAIRWKLKDMLDFHVDDATIDVLEVPLDKDAPVRNRSMYAVAARNQVVEQRQTLFADAKISLSVIDIPDLAQRNIAALLEPPGRGLAMLSFDSDGGLLTVTYAGELYMSRRIDITLAQLESASEEELTPLFERVTLELQRSLDHFDRQYHFITLAKLLLAPLPEKAARLEAYLASNLYTPVASFTLDEVFDFAKVPDLRSLPAQQQYFFALGAALRLEEVTL